MKIIFPDNNSLKSKFNFQNKITGKKYYIRHTWNIKLIINFTSDRIID